MRVKISLRRPTEQRMAVKWFVWVLKICPQFQVLIFSLVWVQWSAQWAFSKKCGDRKYFNSNLGPCYNMYWSKVCSQEYNSTWAFRNENPQRKESVHSGERGVGLHVFNSSSVLKLYDSPWPFCVALSTLDSGGWLLKTVGVGLCFSVFSTIQGISIAKPFQALFSEATQ